MIIKKNKNSLLQTHNIIRDYVHSAKIINAFELIGLHLVKWNKFGRY